MISINVLDLLTGKVLILLIIFFVFLFLIFFVSDSSMGGLRSFGRFDSVDQMNIHQKLYDFNGDDEDEDEDASNSHYT